MFGTEKFSEERWDCSVAQPMDRGDARSPGPKLWDRKRTLRGWKFAVHEKPSSVMKDRLFGKMKEKVVGKYQGTITPFIGVAERGEGFQPIGQGVNSQEGRGITTHKEWWQMKRAQDYPKYRTQPITHTDTSRK